MEPRPFTAMDWIITGLILLVFLGAQVLRVQIGKL